jgi:hypothetical protein
MNVHPDTKVLEESHPLGKTADNDTRTKSPTKQRVAEARNASRWRDMDSADKSLLDKLKVAPHLSSNPEMLSPQPVQGPDDSFQPPIWFLQTMQKIAATATTTPAKPDVMFEMTEEARRYSHDRLTEHDFNLLKLIQANEGTTLDYGSEFRPMGQLEPF